MCMMCLCACVNKVVIISYVNVFGLKFPGMMSDVTCFFQHGALGLMFNKHVLQSSCCWRLEHSALMTRLHRCWSAGVQLHILGPEGNNWIGVMMPAHWSFLRPKFKVCPGLWTYLRINHGCLINAHVLLVNMLLCISI
ncbi:hypothetical protein ILYODFUR_032438 [Ilyodon furcidens]|uniref:Secreted protein n=1 Tax=Ilyodon furcidens TaxID=33524 RepID=A0ABV0U3C1_9TELE